MTGKRGINESCYDSTNCDDKAGLICQAISNTCNCPLNYFYNLTTKNCRMFILKKLIHLHKTLFCTQIYFKKINFYMVQVA